MDECCCSTTSTIAMTTKQIRSKLAQHRKSLSENDLLNEIDNALVFSKGFLYAYGKLYFGYHYCMQNSVIHSWLIFISLIVPFCIVTAVFFSMSICPFQIFHKNPQKYCKREWGREKICSHKHYFDTLTKQKNQCYHLTNFVNQQQNKMSSTCWVGKRATQPAEKISTKIIIKSLLHSYSPSISLSLLLAHIFFLCFIKLIHLLLLK